MKHLKLPLFLLMLTVNVCCLFAQETKQIKKSISPTLIERYSVLKIDKHIKEGDYVVSDLGNHILVVGQYKNGKKDSIWNYMDQAGNVIQKYNYNDSTFLINNADNITIVHSDYKITDEVTTGGTVSAPAQIGGANYGFYLFYDPKSIPPQVENQTSVVKMTYSFTIDTAGKPTNGVVSYTGAGIDLTQDVSVKNLPADIYGFLPAKIGGKAVNSNLLYSVDLNINKSRQPREYSTPTQDSKMSQGVYH